MTNAKILTSIEECIKYLSMVGFDVSPTPKRKELNLKKYSDQYFQAFHKGDYQEIFLTAADNSDFDIAIDDGSFFQFTSSSENEIHYSFFNRVEIILSYEEFEEKYLTDNNIDSIAQEYEMYLSTDKPKIIPCPIRYDVSKNEYQENLHAYAHFHFGFRNEIRIPSDKIIKPISFVDFVIKHTYRAKWDCAYKNDEKFRAYVNALKNQSEAIDTVLFTDSEKNFLFLT